MKFLRFLSVFFLVSCITFINDVYAQTKIGIIDTNKVVEKCTAYVQAKKVIEDVIMKWSPCPMPLHFSHRLNGMPAFDTENIATHFCVFDVLSAMSLLQQL
jgi:hypothetical protein